MSISKNKKGFTLIELLVVIAIIGILTAIVTSNFTQSKAKARDSKRVSDVAQIQLALELFFDRCNQYPRVLNVNYTCPTNATVKLANYISAIPVTPKPTFAGYDTYTRTYYTDTTSPTNYFFKVRLETNNSVLEESYIPPNSTNYYHDTCPTSCSSITSPAPVLISCSVTATLFEYCVVPK